MISRGQIFELVFWLGFAALAYVMTFDFDQELEIYAFGAHGWPRAVIAVIVLSALGQAYHDLRFYKTDADEEAEDEVERGGHYVLRMAAILGLPLVYAALLSAVGFYVLTPFFILAFLLFAGERRLPWLIGVTLGIYGFLLIAFARIFYVGLPVGTMRPFYDISNALLVLIR